MRERTEVGLPRTVAIAWGMVEAPTRGPSRGLSHERIVAAGIEIADAEGLAAVTMARVAEALGFTTMSLYRYVSGKEELLELMMDAAGRLERPVTLDKDWRVALRQWAQLLRDGTHAHPWTLELPRTQHSLLMPNAMAVADLGLQAVASLRCEDQERIAVILMVSEHVLAMVSLELALAKEGAVELGPEAVAMLAEAVDPQRFPALARLIAQDAWVFASDTPAQAERDLSVDFEYDFGLDRIIAGLEALELERE